MGLEIQNGKAVVWGIGGTIAITGIATFILQDGKLDHKFKETRLEDEQEQDVSWIATNEHFETTITWTPAGATRAGALATITIPEPFKKITMCGFDADILNGDWGYVGDATLNLTHTAGKMSMKVRRYLNEQQNTNFVTNVSG